VWFKSSLKIVVLFLLLFSGLTSHATHLLGGYMNYEFLNIDGTTGDYRYKITFHVYRDCSGDVQLDDRITLGVYLNDINKSLNQQPVFNLVTKQRVQPPGSIDCDFYRKNVCIEYGLYEGIVSLKPYSEGYHITYTRCCRNVQNNIIQDGAMPSQGQTYYCFIPATALRNSSPAFYGVPSPYMCVNDTNSFLFDAVDRDGDSLVYRFMRPYQGGSAASSSPAPSASLDTPLLRYKAGYTSLSPFGANGYTFIDNQTGYTELFSNEVGNFVVGVEVLEYRNGNLLGKIRMDLQIIVLNCIANNIPNISSNKGQRFEIEAGEELCFDVIGKDPDDDQVKLSARGEVFTTIPGTKATFVGPLFDRQDFSYEFCWTPDCDADRDQPYNVYFTVEDDGCPPKFNYLDVSIKVLPFEGAKIMTGPTTVCKFSSHIYAVTDGNASSSYEWDIFDGKFIGDSTSESVTAFWKGNSSGGMMPYIRVREVSANGCLGDWIQLDVDIKESPIISGISGKDTVCKEDVGLTYSVTDNPGNTYYWETVNAIIGSQNRNSIQLSGFNQPSFNIRVAETNSIGCTSDTVELEVFVIESSPTLNGPLIVCPNSSGVQYQAIGASSSTFNWNVTGGVQSSGGNTNTITIDWGDDGMGQITVAEINKFGCLSTSVVVDVSKSYVLGNDRINGPNEICEFDKLVSYDVDSVRGSVYDWTITGGVQQNGDSSSQIQVDWLAAGLGNIRVVQRAYDPVNDRWCTSPPNDLSVTIHPTPTADQISGPVELCQFTDTATYSILGMPNSTYHWTLNGSMDNIVGQGTNTIKIFWDVSGNQILSVVETNVFGCTGSKVDLSVIINPKPNTSLITGPIAICPENIGNQSYSVTGGLTSTFDWKVLGALNVSGNSTPIITVDWDLIQTNGQIRVVEISDKGCLGDTQRLDVNFDKLEIDLRFVSVGDPDDRMIIDWQVLNNSSASSFDIKKRTPGASSWQNLASIGGSTFQYLEEGINTDITPFEYQVSALNLCGTSIFSDVHRSILLTGIQDEDLNSNLIFTDYLGWNVGISAYDLFLEDNINPLTLSQINVNSNTTIVSMHDPKQYKKCFRVNAQEDGGEQTESWSNEVCFYFLPTVYVPNAFTPNNDNLNDGFGVKGIAINEFSIEIYNRWGEKLYQSNDINEKWLPNYMGNQIQEGIYLYLINYSDYNKNNYRKAGTITLLK
jgi:gliding motility-associated-like protein